MNCKLEKFWNCITAAGVYFPNGMNCKLEKFWNSNSSWYSSFTLLMNYKFEKFWNCSGETHLNNSFVWTVNLKSFEIKIEYF